jgi:hypothetical protein
VYSQNDESTSNDPSNDPSNEPSNERGSRPRDDGGRRVRLIDSHSFNTKIVDLRPMDDGKCGIGGIDLGSFW